MRLLYLVVFLFLIRILPAQETSAISLFDTLYNLKDVHFKLTYPFDSQVKTGRLPGKEDAYGLVKLSKEV